MSAHRDDHPIFGAIEQTALGAVADITERRIEQARKDGLFDNLSGAGKPIADIDVERRPGWFAERLVTTERHKLAAYKLEETLRAAMTAVWRLPAQHAVEDRVHELNKLIDGHNRTNPQGPVEKLNLSETLATWDRLGAKYPDLRARKRM